MRGGRDIEAVSTPRGTDPIDRLMARLDGVRHTGVDRYVARCPSHDDRRPSLSIRMLPDGRLLLKCWSGCSAAEVVAAAGLELRDLFPERPEHHRPAERKPWRDAGLEGLRALVDEVNLVFVVAARMCAGIGLTDSDRDALALACERLNGALLLVEGGHRRG